jgi:hypothetical protein
MPIQTVKILKIQPDNEQQDKKNGQKAHLCVDYSGFFRIIRK